MNKLLGITAACLLLMGGAAQKQQDKTVYLMTEMKSPVSDVAVNKSPADNLLKKRTQDTFYYTDYAHYLTLPLGAI